MDLNLNYIYHLLEFVIVDMSSENYFESLIMLDQNQF